MKPIIEVENLSKSYHLRLSQMNGGTLREAIAETVKAPFKRAGQDNSADVLWALKNVSFAVEQGETLGVIGNNGAGKSTLLKILSRITRPTAGRANLRGRVGSLLEVGTGFHPELTGRENVFLNGAILGMKRREIESKYDEIVAFAEVEKFLETPVKHYSSGMFMRLAFSVAAHLEPEILIVDEVLAVGDVNFQHKCLDKMQEIMRRGHTILFVSHNMAAITRLCRRAIALDKGQIVSAGETSAVVGEYLNSNWGLSAEKHWENAHEAPQNETIRLRRARVVNRRGETVGTTSITEAVGIEITYDVLESGHILIPNFHFYNQERTLVFVVQDTGGEWRRRRREPGSYKTTAWIPPNFLNEGNLIVEIAVSSHVPQTRVHVHVADAVGFDVVDNTEENPTRGDYKGKIFGLVRPLVDWTTEVYSK